MSQITRCPSCSTTFKVVADQLRISEGWVRCGQCKEVFDASAHLLAAAPAALLPDVSLTDVRPPPVPVARPSETERAWGKPLPSPPASKPGEERSSPVVAKLSATTVQPAAVQAAQAPVSPPGASEPASDGAGFVFPDEVLPAAPTLEVPLPAVPAFLSAAPGEAASAASLAVEPGAPFSWRARTSDAHTTAAAKPPSVASDAAASASAEEHPAQRPLPPLPSLPPLPAGYELPAAKPSDGGGAVADSGASLELTPMGYPALELPAKAVPSVHPPPPPASPPAPAVSASTPQEPPAPLPPVDFSPQGASQELESEALALVEDRSPAAVLQASRKSPASAKARSTEADEDERDAASADPEVSFVRAARRQAFWRKPQVRVALGALILVALASLALQIAIQERDRLAATDARLRPMLLALCASLQCEIAPPRQIADLVIDSSSFNKARGDSYHLAVTMKNKAAIPLAMPAVELTLTDAQDQPMLRRVLLPADMGAPTELPAGGEWNASVSVIVTTGGARVAGYRLLAFYP